MKPLATLAFLLCACESSDKGPGIEGGPCYPNGTCNTGLTCASNLCVILPIRDHGIPDRAADAKSADAARDSTRPDAAKDRSGPDLPACTSLHFAGQDKVVVPNATAFDFGTTLSVMAWVNVDQIALSHEMPIVTNEYSGTHCPNMEFAIDIAARLWFDVRGGEAPLKCSPTVSVKSTATVPTKKWVHLAAVYETTQVRLYIDGKLDSTHSVVPVDPYPPIHDLWIGREEGIHPGMLGSIRHLQIWSRALSTAEVGAAMTNSLSNTTGLIARWSLTEGGGTIVQDLSSAKHNGTLQGASWTTSYGTCP
jgi:hypothetical protein